MKSHNILAFLSIIFLISSCSSYVGIYQRKQAFVESDYLSYVGKGNCNIKGYAFTKTSGGQTIYAPPGDTVIMDPVTSYTDEWYNQYILKGEPISSEGPSRGEI